jgi:hypothetical protein
VHTFKANEPPHRSQSDNATEPPSPSAAVRSRSRADRKFIVALIGIIVLAFVGNAALGGNTHDRTAHKESDRVAIRSKGSDVRSDESGNQEKPKHSLKVNHAKDTGQPHKPD